MANMAHAIFLILNEREVARVIDDGLTITEEYMEEIRNKIDSVRMTRMTDLQEAYFKEGNRHIGIKDFLESGKNMEGPIKIEREEHNEDEFLFSKKQIDLLVDMYMLGCGKKGVTIKIEGEVAHKDERKLDRSIEYLKEKLEGAGCKCVYDSPEDIRRNCP